MYPNNQNLNLSKPTPYRHSRQDTATKSPDKRAVQRTYDFTPTRFTKKPSQRVSQIKNSINKCIEEISNKKQTNRDALQQVNHVNKEIVEFLSNQAQGKSNRYTTQEVTHRSQYAPQRYINNSHERENVILSSFNLNQAPTSQQFEEIKSTTGYQRSEVQRVPFGNSQIGMTQFDTRSLLQNERIQNDVLQRQIIALRRQNEQLAQYQSLQYPQSDYNIRAQNQRLRNELQQLNSFNIYNIYEEFQKLKDDNERLRRQTINLLQNNNKKY